MTPAHKSAALREMAQWRAWCLCLAMFLGSCVAVMGIDFRATPSGRAFALRVEPVPVSPADAASIPVARGDLK